MSGAITFEPIAAVESEFTDYAPSEEMRSHPSRIILQPELAAGLLGLEVGMDILVLFHFHHVDRYDLQLHPRHDPSRPIRGVFATRSQYRPNPIGATMARILKTEDNVLTVIGLDAQDGTPILDIKPYVDWFDVPG